MARLGFHRRHARQRHQIERADQISWTLLIFGVVRMVAWLAMIVCVILGLLHVSGFAWAKSIGGLVVFVTLISFYANAATEAGNVTAAWAAIRAGRAHAQGVESEQVSQAAHIEMLGRIHDLAELIHEHQLRSEK